jgi:hypothetical protein
MFTIDEALKLPESAEPKKQVMDILFGTYPDGSILEVIVSVASDKAQYHTSRRII